MTVKGPTESEFQRAVIEVARLAGYRVAHFRAAMSANGRWMTPVQADGAGFPDLVLAKPGRLIFAELKSKAGKLSEGQQVWLNALQSAGVEVYVWRPSDMVELIACLKAKK